MDVVRDWRLGLGLRVRVVVGVGVKVGIGWYQSWRIVRNGYYSLGDWVRPGTDHSLHR
jgi:hypothetical protein